MTPKATRVNAEAMLFYGIDLDGQGDSWKIRHVDGPWIPAWLDSVDETTKLDYVELVERRLDDDLDGVRLIRYGRASNPGYALTAYTDTASWIEPEFTQDLEELYDDVVAKGYDAKLHTACGLLRIDVREAVAWQLAVLIDDEVLHADRD